MSVNLVVNVIIYVWCFFFKQKTAYEMRISDWSSDVCSSDLLLVAEGKGGSAPRLTPKDFIAGYFKSKGTSSVKGGDRLTLLRDADGDGRYEGRTIFAKDLNAPYGLAPANGPIYVATQDSLVRFAYSAGQTKASGPPVNVPDLPSKPDERRGGKEGGRT